MEFQRNQPIYCRILELDPDKFSATCSCRSSDLRGLQPQNSEFDRYFDRQACQVTRKTQFALQKVVYHLFLS